MIDDWFEVIELPITIEQFHRLPTNPAYKYEYFDDTAYLSPRPKCYEAMLDLGPVEVPEEIDAWGPVVLRPLREEDWEAFPPLFAGAFQRVQPFCGLDDDRRLRAAKECLVKTRAGGDGPLLPDACAVAVNKGDGHPVGAALVTLRKVREDDGADFRDQGNEHPHLTWIFVAPLITRHGIGSALLAATIRGLLGMGRSTLASTFLLGNESSTLWHWRNGFRVLGYRGSPRAMMTRVERLSKPGPPAPPA